MKWFLMHHALSVVIGDTRWEFYTKYEDPSCVALSKRLPHEPYSEFPTEHMPLWRIPVYTKIADVLHMAGWRGEAIRFTVKSAEDRPLGWDMDDLWDADLHYTNVTVWLPNGYIDVEQLVQLQISGGDARQLHRAPQYAAVG